MSTGKEILRIVKSNAVNTANQSHFWVENESANRNSLNFKCFYRFYHGWHEQTVVSNQLKEENEWMTLFSLQPHAACEGKRWGGISLTVYSSDHRRRIQRKEGTVGNTREVKLVYTEVSTCPDKTTGAATTITVRTGKHKHSHRFTPNTRQQQVRRLPLKHKLTSVCGFRKRS